MALNNFSIIIKVNFIRVKFFERFVIVIERLTSLPRGTPRQLVYESCFIGHSNMGRNLALTALNAPASLSFYHI